MSAAPPETGLIWQAERMWLGLTQRISSVGVLGMLAVATLTVADVLLRYLLNSPLSGLNEIVSLTLAVAIAACLPAGLARRVGLEIDILARVIGPRTRAWFSVVGHFLLLGFFVLLAWRFAVFTLGVDNTGLTTIILGWPQAPFLWIVAALLAICMPVQFTVACTAVREVCRTRGCVLLAVLLAIAVMAGIAILAANLPRNAFSDLLPGTPAGLALWFFALLWVLILCLVPIGPAMGFAGLLGAAALMGMDPALSVLGSETKKYLTNESLATLPLFLLMGSFAAVSGLSADLYRLAQTLLSHRRGGLALATIGGCAGFGALTGSSVATAVTIGKIALPEMKQRGYDDGLATGCVAAGGTLGQIVPPSTAIIIFAFLTEESIGKMFVAAIVPAIVALALYMITVSVVVRLNPKACPPAERRDWREVLPALGRCWGALLLFTLVIGGLYGGIFTESEAASVGAFGAFLFALFRGKLKNGEVWRVMAEATASIAMIYTLIFGAVMFSFFIGATRLPNILGSLIQSADLAPFLVVIIFLAVYLALGTVMESFAIMVITVPVFAPIVGDLGYSMIWWGLLTVCCVETGMISPPFGLNLFVLKSVAPDTPLTTIYRGVLPFCVADFVRLAILVAFPGLVLWLPQTM